MQYSEYEDLLEESRPGTAADLRQDYQENSLSDDPDLEALLTESHEQERQRIETELGQIESQLQKRTEILDESVGELKDAIRDEKDRLQRLQRPFIPENQVASQQRQIRELEQQLQDIQRAHWQDCEQLQRERRRLRRELSELTETDLSLFL